MITSIPTSAEGAAAIAHLREQMRQRPRDETQTVEARRAAIAAATAQASAAARATPLVLAGVPVERHAPDGRNEARVGVFLHGGAFVIGSAATHRALAAAIATASGLILYAVDYRLAPEHPFPTGRDDVLAVCKALRGRGAKEIVLIGDSAGGGLALHTVAAMRARGEPLPSWLVLMSPWVDLACSGESFRKNSKLDPMLSHQGLLLDAERYLAGRSPNDPAVAPLHADLSGLPPVLITVGEDEILLDDSLQLATSLSGSGVQVSLEVWEGMSHAWYAFRGVLPEADRVIASIAAFLLAPNLQDQQTL